MGILGFLTGNAKSVEKVIDAGISGIDKLIFTDEEKADYNQKLQSMHLEFVRISASESTAQSISRRLICLPVVYVWLILVLTSTIAAVFNIQIDAESLSNNINTMSTPALAAIGFYVGRHMIGGLKSKD